MSRNFVTLGGGEVGARLIAFVGTAYAARTLGASEFGVVGVALAFCSYLSIGVTAGLHEIGARDVAQHPRNAASIAANVVAVRLLLALVAFAVVVAVALQLDRPPIVRWVFVLVGLSLFPMALDTSWVFKGLAKTKPVGIALVSAQVVAVVAILTFIRGPDDIAILPFASFAGEAFAAVLLGVLVLRMGRSKPDLRAGLGLLKSSAPLATTRAFRALIFTLDVVLLSVLTSDADVGVYTASYRVCFFLLAVSTALALSYLPKFVASADALTGVVSHALEFAAWVGLPMVVGGIMVATPLLEALFGSEYTSGAPAFRVLLVSIGILFLYAPIHNAFLVLRKIRSETWIVGVAALINLVLNLLLIPKFGLMGAATATVVAEGTILIAGVLYLRRLGVAPELRGILRPVLLTALMAVVVQLTLSFGLFVGVASGALAYGALTMLSGFVPRDAHDLVDLRERIRRWMHHRFTSRSHKRAEATRIMAGREYYELYDDLYRQIDDNDVKTTDLFGIDKARALIYADIDKLIEAGRFPNAGSRLIDLGCGDGGNALHLAGLGYHVTGVDVSPTAVRIASEEAQRQGVACEFRQDDITKLETCQEDSYDAATSFGVLHMLVSTLHRSAYLRSVRRVLRSGGWFVLFESMSASDVVIEDEDEHIQDSVSHVDHRFAGDEILHVRGCGFRSASLAQYEAELAAAGFELEEQHAAWSPGLPFGMILVRAI